MNYNKKGPTDKSTPRDANRNVRQRPPVNSREREDEIQRPQTIARPTGKTQSRNSADRPTEGSINRPSTRNRPEANSVSKNPVANKPEVGSVNRPASVRSSETQRQQRHGNTVQRPTTGAVQRPTGSATQRSVADSTQRTAPARPKDSQRSSVRPHTVSARPTQSAPSPRNIQTSSRGTSGRISPVKSSSSSGGRKKFNLFGTSGNSKIPNWVFLAIAVLAVAGVGIAAVNLLQINSNYNEGTEEYDGLQQHGPQGVIETSGTNVAVSTETNTAESNGNNEVEDTQWNLEVKFDELKKINEDISSWLYIKDTVVNYPVVHGKDNQYYVNYTFEKKKNIAGALFLDYRNKGDYSDKNNVIYGHNMKNGSMLHALTQYEKQDFFDEHKTAFLITPNETYLLEVFSVFIPPVNEPYRTMKFKSDKEFTDFVKKYQGKSLVKTDVTVTAKDKIVTFSTCTEQHKDTERFAVMAKMVPFDLETNQVKNQA